MALPLFRLPLLPSLPAACQPPLRHPEHCALPRHGHISFVVPTANARSSGIHAAFAACAASASVAPAPAPAPAETETETETEAEAEEEEPVGPRTGLIAMNIPWDFTADDMRALFEKQGTVVGVEEQGGDRASGVLMEALVANFLCLRALDANKHIIDAVWHSKKNRGLAFVTMGSEEEALSALNNLNLTILNDRTIKVDFVKPRTKKPIVQSAPMQNNIVFEGNLTWRVRSRHLRELFASTPGVQSVEVIFHTTTPRQSAGYAFVSFSSKEEAEAAISAFNGKGYQAAG